jgi:hypothetical protein
MIVNIYVILVVVMLSFLSSNVTTVIRPNLINFVQYSDLAACCSEQ